MAARTVLIGAVVGAALLTACGTSEHQEQPAAPSSAGGFRTTDCNGITDADVTTAAGSAMFTKTVVSDTGCFWQENTVLGTFGAGMGISTCGTGGVTWTPNGRWKSVPDAP